MKTYALAVAVAAAAVGVAHADPAADGLSAKAEACIRAAAPEVSRLTPNPSEAVTFLVGDLCAVEIQRAEAYAGNARTLAELQASMPPAAVANVSLDPVTGELKTPSGFAIPMGVTGSLLSSLRNQNPRARYAAFAARAVLAARAGH